MTVAAPKDLVVLVADKDMEQTVQGLCRRHRAFDIAQIQFDVFPHPNHDAGCRKNGVGFLRTFIRQYRYALLIFDREGCGRDSAAAVAIEAELEEQLKLNGWADRSAVIVLDPELEIWIWSESPHVDDVVGWKGHSPALREWLVQNQYMLQQDEKPARPKEAFRSALRKVNLPPSAALFRKLADKVSFKSCNDRSFQKLSQTLKHWFPLQ